MKRTACRGLGRASGLAIVVFVLLWASAEAHALEGAAVSEAHVANATAGTVLLRLERDRQNSAVVRLAGDDGATPTVTDDDDFAAEIGAADEDRKGGPLVPNTERPFADGRPPHGSRGGPPRSPRQERPSLDEGRGKVVTLPPPEQRPGSGGSGARSSRDGAREPARSAGPAASDTDGASTAEAQAPSERRFDLVRPTISAAKLIGRTVRDLKGEKLGEIEDVRLSLETGEAETVVLKIDSGFLGLFGRTTSVAASAISIDPLDGSVVIARSALDLEDK